MWRRAMHYLGLGPDDEYDDGQMYSYEDPSAASATQAAPRGRQLLLAVLPLHQVCPGWMPDRRHLGRGLSTV